jgi:hypothetical protein
VLSFSFSFLFVLGISFLSLADGAFVRLCGRSPKDGDPLNPQEIYRRYMREVNLLLEDGHENTPNTQFVAFSRVNWMKVHKPFFFSVFFLSHSNESNP